MTRTRVGGTLALALLTGLVFPSVAQAGRPRCAGASVTIHFQDPGVGTTIVGTSGRDVIQGGPSGETIRTGGGHDIVCGGGGGDSIDGGIGRDHLRGQGGRDTFVAFGSAPLADDDLVGGGDRDQALYLDSPFGVNVNQATGVVVAIGSAAHGSIAGVEVVFGSDQDDILVSGGAVRGLTGNDIIEVINGSATRGEFDGGPGDDRLSYRRANNDVRINVGSGSAVVGTGGDDFERFERYEGTRFDDQIIGDFENNHLIGGGGDDLLKGSGGDDILEGQGGDDVIHPGSGDDFVDGGGNDPVTSIGEHGDLVSYQGATIDNGVDEFHAWLMIIPPFYPDPPGAEGVGLDDFVGVESIRGPRLTVNYLNGDNGPNVLISGDRPDGIDAHGGNDLLFGLGGNTDVLNGMNGDDYLDGGLPSNENDTDLVDGDVGDDTCTGTMPEFYAGCETIF